MIRSVALVFGAVLWAAPSFAELLTSGAEVPRADVVLLGETHDNPDHHLFQAEAVAVLKPAVVVWEMMPEGPFDPTADGFADDWAARGWPDWPLYAPIFEAAPEAAHLGMAQPRDAVRAAMTGPAPMEDAARFGLDAPLPEEEQMAREAAQQAGHCGALPGEMLPGFVAAQRFRDASFARVVLDALEAHGPPVAVITGSGHTRLDWGMPVYLRAAAPEVSVVSLGQFEETVPEALPFDVWAVAPAAEREDPCAAFR